MVDHLSPTYIYKYICVTVHPQNSNRAAFLHSILPCVDLGKFVFSLFNSDTLAVPEFFCHSQPSFFHMLLGLE